MINLNCEEGAYIGKMAMYNSSNKKMKCCKTNQRKNSQVLLGSYGYFWFQSYEKPWQWNRKGWGMGSGGVFRKEGLKLKALYDSTSTILVVF